MKPWSRILAGLLVLLLVAPTTTAAASAVFPVTFTDAADRSVTVDRPPQRVVSLVPAVTEILFGIGAGDRVSGVTTHDAYPSQAARKPVVGGFFEPDVMRIAALDPDLIFVSDLHHSVVAHYAGKVHPQLIQLPLASVDELVAAIGLLGRLFEQGAAAEALVETIQAELDHTAAKIAPIPESRRKRVMRLMGHDSVMTPGQESFQNELIRLAGGIPPAWGGQPGAVIPVSLEAWQAFNPEFIYGCGDERILAQTRLLEPGWRDVDAVRNGRIHFFPCDLTCRLSTRSGGFVSRLAAQIYADQLADLPAVRKSGPTATRPLSVTLDYVDGVEVIESAVNDYIHKTVLIHLQSPMTVVSTLEGVRHNIRHVGNSYWPPQVWQLYHHIGLDAARGQLMGVIGRDAVDTSLLYTGADMDHLSIQRRDFKAMTVYALVTASARSNAMRMGQDNGAYYEPGTINIILLSNMQLTPRAMQRAIVAATEAKTAALWDLDVRSAYTPLVHPATGTGTDNIIVVQGAGRPIDNAGGHTKMGELIAGAVYAAVQEALFEQNSIFAGRHLFQRLSERNLSPFGLVSGCDCGLGSPNLIRELEALLMEPEFAGFIEAALVVSDQYDRGLIADISAFEVWCDQMAAMIAGEPVFETETVSFSESLPPVLQMAFEALLKGIAAREAVPEL
ncbi:MAG: adenosylcobinamide amidohydrolase [Desulfosarcina sp.]